MLRSPVPLLLALWVAACGGDPDEVAAETEEAAEPPPVAAPAKAPAAEEPVTGRGIAKEQRVFVRGEPREDARAVGLLRWGQRFEISDTEEAGGTTWHRMRGIGWLLGSEVNARFDGEEAALGFIPVEPRLDSSMPYRIARVTAKSIPVYRRPPRRGEDPQRAFMRDLAEGYFFSIDKFVNIYDRQLYRTTRYWFIPRDGTTPVAAPSFEGIEVTADTALPFLWVTDPTARLCDAPIDPRSTERPPCEPVERHTRLGIAEQRNVGGTWYRTPEGKWIGALQVARVSRLQNRPEGVGPGDRWIHVDLRNQFAALYEGDRMTFVTLVSSGDDEHATPTGTFRIESKHVTATMDDEDNMSGPYFIQDVPWVLYFQGSYALHGAFWHDRFGLKTSHGCVNLSPRDARRFFHFVTTPELPAGLHAVFTPAGARGTVVHITG